MDACFPSLLWTNIFIFIYHHVGITKVQLFGLAALHRRLLWGSVKDNFGPKMHIFLHSQANFGRFFADQPTGQESRPVFCGIGVQKRVIYVSPRWNDKMATFLTTALHRSRVESNFGAQSTCIMLLRSQFWTFFEPTDPDSMQNCEGNVLTLPLLCLDIHSMLFWPIGGPFSKKKMQEIHVLQNTEIRLENTRNTRTGCATRSSRPEISESVWYGGQQLSGPASTNSAI